MNINVRLDLVAFGVGGLALCLFALWYFSTGEQFKRAVERNVSWCHTDQEKSKIRELSKYVLPGEKAVMVLIFKDKEKMGGARCSWQ